MVAAAAAGGGVADRGRLHAALLSNDVARGHDILHQVRLALRVQSLVAADAPYSLLLDSEHMPGSQSVL